MKMSEECEWSQASANRVVRGGSWNSNARNVRAAYRNWNSPDNRNNNLGFRCRTHEESGWAPREQTTHQSVFRPSSDDLICGKQEMAAGVRVADCGCVRENSPASRS